VEWKPGSVVVPPNQWFHQHFNSGAHPARYLALRWGSWRFRFMRHLHQEGSTYTSVKAGGAQIEFDDENPEIHADFEAAVAKAGALCQMGGYHPSCTHRATSQSIGV
jgi:hypothetical protein